jgi:integrase
VERDLRPEFGQLKVAGVTRQDVHKFHAAQAHRPRQANLILAVLSKAFSLAELWEMRPEGTNPCRRIQRYPESHRERFLSSEELARLGAVLRRAESEGLPQKNGRRTLYRRAVTGAIDLLLYTGCRLSEVLNLRWEHIDFATGVIKLADTKSGGPQLVTMNPPARQVLKVLEAERRGSDWVVLSVSNPNQPISKAGIEAAWRKLATAAQIEDVRMHDLRHTVGTYAGQTGANAFLVRDLLRHKNLAMTHRYVNRADSPVRTLSDQVGERIAAAMAGQPGAEVVPLKPAKAS